MTFTQFPLDDRVQRAIVAAGFQTPTPIQAAAIPVALAGGDLLGTAQTGTGKTAAFVLPLLQRLLATPAAGPRTRALILLPTRELAGQVHEAIRQLARFTKLRSATVYGGVGMAPQERALREGAEMIVACPGRLLDHLQRGYVDLRALECLILDEADRMLDMGFLPDIRRIVSQVPAARQTMLFAATFAPDLDRFAAQILRDPARVAVGTVAPASTVEHTVYPVPAHLKMALLLALLQRISSDAVLIFTRTKHRADKVTAALRRAGYAVGVLHADRTQKERQRALDAFRAGTVPYLVATDIAARGLDVSTVSHVINYDIPENADTYIHRIGRTGRAERNGDAFTLVTTEDYDIVRVIERSLGERLPTQTLDGFNYQQAATAMDARTGGSGRGAGNGRPHPGLAYLSSPNYRAALEAARKTGG
ncbi:MAG TPA: DEAD/DEAH box helicase [Armatimonadota bacterium]|nr:DEAD/DEAH box helicase [Armatimonadota bacterium]HOS42923.1 DEAD/DEAH box helicase [Armatimonadota bacterium]